jgi:hypothetical protein
LIDVKNELPIAVHHASGGNARVRVGGQAISLNGVSTGSFEIGDVTCFRVSANLRTSAGFLVVIGYTGPVTLANASRVFADTMTIEENVPDHATVYYALVDPGTAQITEGGAQDYLYVSLYD